MSHFNAYLKAWLVVVLGLFTVHSAVYSQTEHMFSISLDNSLTLVRTSKQQALLERITQRETTAKVQIFKVSDIAEMANSTALRFGTQNEIIYSLNNSGNKTANGSTSLWQGKSNASDPNMTTLVFDSMDITGSVWLHGQLYKIEPLGDGVHAFIEFDQSKVLECGQPVEPKEESTGGETLDKSNVMLQTDPPVIDVLVAYTTAAKNASGNINSLIQLAVAEANQSYQNSDVTLYMNLVYTYEVSYTETGNTDEDLDNFTFTGGSYSDMDEVHTYRDQYGADVCVLIISSTTDGTLGIGWLNPGASQAFSVVRYDYATGYYTFAHEIGHNLNCRHDRCDDPGGTYNHGYEYCSGNWRTIMAYNQSCCVNATTRIQYWSNPDKTYNGVAMGTAQYEDNARMLEEDSPGVAAFKSSFTSGTLTTNQTWYYKTLTGNVTIADGVTLTIMPGATINFTGNYKLRVEGTLLANGTYSDKITFTRSGGTWYGIEFYNASYLSQISYSIIQNAQYGARIINSSPNLTWNSIKLNTVGVQFENNSYDYAGALQGNIVEDNFDGIKCYQYSDPTLNPSNVIRHHNIQDV